MSNSIVKKEISGHEYIFYNSFHGTRNGFYHKSELWIDGKLEATEKIGYLNRTWEMCEYETVMKKLVKELQFSIYSDWKKEWKNTNGIKRVTKEKDRIMQKEFETHKPESYVNLEKLYIAL